jgi:chemotaxis protein histidine kinase CheA
VDRITEQLDQLSELADEQVVELQAEIISEFETVESQDPSPQTVDAMTSLADMLDTVRSEVKRREVLAAELAQRAAEAANRVYGQDGDTEENMEEGMEKEEEEKSMTEAAMPMEEDVPVVPAADEAPMEDAPVMEDVEVEVEEEAPMPKAKSDEDEDDEMEMSTMSEASAAEEKTVELSTEETPEAPAEETVVAAAEEAVAVTDTETELSVEEEVVVEEAVVAAAEETASVDAEVDAEASVQEEITETPTQTMEAPVTAAADNADNLDIEVPADRRPVTQATAAPVAITAGADIPGYTAGSPLEDMSTVAEAMAKRLHALRRVNGGDGEQHIVASVTTSFPEARTLGTDAEENWNKIQNVVGPEALVAAGGHQAPFEVRYDIFGFGTTNRPVRDALPRFQADRGGIRYILPPVLSSYDNAVGVWTSANDAAETPNPAAKNSLTVEAASETTVATDAVTLQMQFGNLATRAYPELIARHNELGLIQHSREAEQYLLSKIAAGSTAVTTTSLIGFGRDMLVQLGRAAAAYRSRHRLEADAPLRAILPSWVKDAMAADLTLSMPGDSTLNAYSEIDGYMAARGVVASYSLDQNVYGAQGAAALLEFADSFTWYLFSEGTFLFLDGGTLDLGIIRDSSLVGTNDYKMFVETFEGVAKVGIESLAITSTISVNGVAAALRDTTGGATAAAIEY